MSAAPYQRPDDPRQARSDYYAREDNRDTPEAALESWRTQARALHGAASDASINIERLEHNLGTLYQQAEARHDADALQQISDAWGRAQQLYATLAQLDAAMAGAGQTIKTLNHQRIDLVRELASLTRAIEIVDTHDARLANFAADIQADAYEAAYDTAVEEAGEIASEEHYNVMFETLAQYGLRARHVNRLLDLLEGNIEINPEQAEWLAMFCDSLSEEGV
jgi:chromosome segregation ATPase